MLVDVFTVTYGDCAAVAPLLQSLLVQSAPLGNVWIWHNGPQPFNRRVLLPFEELQVQVHETGENLGYGEGINRLFDLSKADVAVVVNPDVTLDSKCVNCLANAASSTSGSVIVGGLLIDHDNQVNAFAMSLTSDGLGINLDRGTPSVAFTSVNADLASRMAVSPSGALFAVNRIAWMAMGGGPLFVGSLFLYLEDVALGLRVRRLGGNMVFCSDAKGVHRYSDSTGRRSALKLFYVERNRLWLQRALGGRALALATMPFTLLRFSAYALQLARYKARDQGKSGQGGSKDLVGALLRAWRDGFLERLPPDLVPYLGPNRAGVSLKQYQAPFIAQLRDPTA